MGNEFENNLEVQNENIRHERGQQDAEGFIDFHGTIFTLYQIFQS